MAIFAAVQAVAKNCREVTVAALCRTSAQDVVRAAEALRDAAHPRIHTFVATSDIHLEYKLKKTRNEVLEMTRDAVQLARSYAEVVEFSAEDATRSDVDDLCDVFNVAVAEGATILNVPIRLVTLSPMRFSQLIRSVRKRVIGDRNDITISVHCHNDLAWRWRTVWQRSTQARGRSNARSMGLASARVTHRWKKL
jgi:2-isopropylmalate synthase